MVEVSVVIPSLNEAETVGTCIEKIIAVFSSCGIDGEIIVSDNSVDSTPDIARSLGAVVVTPDRRGYGYAYLYGFRHAKGDYLVMGDADDTYDFGEMLALLEPLRNGQADFVIGTRLNGSIKPGAMPWLHRWIGNPFLTWFLNLSFKAGVSDAHCGLRAIRREALEKLSLRSPGMEFASEMIIKASRAGLRISEVPVTYYPRKGGASKLNSFSDGWRHLKYMLVYAPTYLYLVPGLFFSVLGGLLMLVSYFRIYVGYTPGFHSMSIGSLFLLMGYQVIFLGLFAKIYGVGIELFDHDSFTSYVREHVSLERGALLGAGVFLVGLGYGVYLLARWVWSGYSLLPSNGQDIVASTLLILGVQTFFNSFLLSLLGERVQ